MPNDIKEIYYTMQKLDGSAEYNWREWDLKVAFESTNYYFLCDELVLMNWYNAEWLTYWVDELSDFKNRLWWTLWEDGRNKRIYIPLKMLSKNHMLAIIKDWRDWEYAIESEYIDYFIEQTQNKDG